MTRENYNPEENVDMHTDGEYLEDYSDFKPSPIKEDGEDELWEQVAIILKTRSLSIEREELKSKFHITRKQ